MWYRQREILEERAASCTFFCWHETGKREGEAGRERQVNARGSKHYQTDEAAAS